MVLVTSTATAEQSTCTLVVMVTMTIVSYQSTALFDVDVWYDVDIEWCSNAKLGDFWVDEFDEVHFADDVLDYWFEDDEGDGDGYDKDDGYDYNGPSATYCETPTYAAGAHDHEYWETHDDGYLDENGVYIFPLRNGVKGVEKVKFVFAV